MPKLLEKAESIPLSFQLRWSLYDLKNGMLPYFPLKKRADGVVHAAYHWTQVRGWLRTITRR